MPSMTDTVIRPETIKTMMKYFHLVFLFECIGCFALVILKCEEQTMFDYFQKYTPTVICIEFHCSVRLLYLS